MSVMVIEDVGSGPCQGFAHYYGGSSGVLVTMGDRQVVLCLECLNMLLASMLHVRPYDPRLPALTGAKVEDKRLRLPELRGE